MAQHLAAPATVDPAAGEGGQRRHHQKSQCRPEGQLAHAPAGFGGKVGQHRRKGIVDAGIGQGLADGQEPDGRADGAHNR